MCRLLSKKVSGSHAAVNNVIEAVQVARRGWSHAPHIFMVCHGTDLCTVVFTCFVRNIWYLNIWSRGLFIGRLTFCGKISVCCGWNLWKRAKPFNLYPCWCHSHVHAIIVGAYYETCIGFRLSLISILLLMRNIVIIVQHATERWWWNAAKQWSTLLSLNGVVSGAIEETDDGEGVVGVSDESLVVSVLLACCAVDRCSLSGLSLSTYSTKRFIRIWWRQLKTK